MRIEPPQSGPAAKLLPQFALPSAKGTDLANLSAPATPAKAASSGDSLSLSDTGLDLARRGLQESGEIMADLTRGALSQLGITSKAEALGAKIEFDSLSFKTAQVTSISASRSFGFGSSGGAGAYQQTANLSFRQEQQSAITAKGTITTADGRKFEFESELLVANKRELQIETSESGEADSAADLRNLLAQFQGGPGAGGNAFQAQSPLFKMLDDVLNRLQQGQDLGLTELLQPASSGTPGQGIAVGEPNPGRAPQAGNVFADLQNSALQQLRASADNLSRLLDNYPPPTTGGSSAPANQPQVQGYPTPVRAEAA